MILVNWRRLRGISAQAKTNAFDELRVYKHFLRQGQWRSATLISLALIGLALLGWTAAPTGETHWSAWLGG